MAAKGAETTCLHIDRDGSGGKPSGRRDLQRENEHLRRLLTSAETVAARYTVMLREGDHRIKNSLQIVASLMSLQAAREESKTARDALRAAAARIQSVARIHDALQASGGEDLVDLGEILEKMCQALHAMAGDPLKIAVVVSVESIRIPASHAQPLVFAVNELVVNALRHAFPDGRSGSVSVKVAQVSNELQVVVTDDGRGLPPDYAEGEGYGMKMVRMMAAQIGGVLDVDSSIGSRFALIAPMPAALT